MIDHTFYDNGVQFSEEYIRVSDGVRLKVLDFKPLNDDESKPVIIFVAGWISLISGWKGVLKILTRHFRTFYFETREKKSAQLPNPEKTDLTIGRMAEDLGTLISFCHC